jgi:hypothetical protein
MIPLKKPEMQDAKFSRNEMYLSYVAWAGKLKQRRRLDFFSGIIDDACMDDMRGYYIAPLFEWLSLP